MKKNETEKELPRPCAKCRRGQEGLCNCNYSGGAGYPCQGFTDNPNTALHLRPNF